MIEKFYCYIKRTFIPKDGEFCKNVCAELCVRNLTAEGSSLPDGMIPK